MIFSAPEFFVFFAIYFAMHLATPHALRIYLIIVGSTIFYAFWDWRLTWLPFLLSAIAYFAAIHVDKANDPVERRWRVGWWVALLLLPLGIVKYGNFVWTDIAGAFWPVSGPWLNMPLPLGISFLTFTIIAYVVDVYRRRYPLVRQPVTLLGYILFFPHLIAGPILRPHELIPQLRRETSMQAARYILALGIFTLGLVKKLVFADQLSVAVEAGYGHSANVEPLTALLAIYGFAAQIYCDFSGYTDMAIGLALALGIRLPRNFERPYLATSVADFWHRWHITLSRWLRDYLYIPLGGNRHGPWAQARNVFVTMTLGGLWHGANWTFVFWGVLHGAGVAAGHAWRHLGLASLFPRWLAIFLTFHFVLVAWVFFRAPNFAIALDMLRAPFTNNSWNAITFVQANAFYAVLLVLFFILHPFDRHALIRFGIRAAPRAVVAISIFACWMLAITLSTGSSSKFIYFDF